MHKIQDSFLLRFSLEVEIADEQLDDDDFDEASWRAEWERAVKPRIVRAVFDALRETPEWTSHIRNRGAPTDSEIEVVVSRTYGGRDVG
ncbi:MAG: hypothetical protein P8R42_11855 [Candidatus Binatia bacterium]|nr:hypothetical protein [Candidatus Binatia bacterium]